MKRYSFDVVANCSGVAILNAESEDEAVETIIERVRNGDVVWDKVHISVKPIGKRKKIFSK